MALKVAVLMAYRSLFASATPNPDDAIKLVDTVSQRGLIWWLSGLVIFGAVALYMLVRMILRNQAQIVAELRKEKIELAEQVRKDREAAETKAGRLHEQLLATNQRFVEHFGPLINANTQAQERSANALTEVERTMRDGVNKITVNLSEMTGHVEKSGECCDSSRKASEATLRGVEGVAQSIRDLMQRPTRNPRQ